MPGDDDAEEPSGSGPPLPPDDRLWRHPSEVTWGPERTTAAAVATSVPTSARLWPVAIAAGLTGAILAVGLVVALGALPGERVLQQVVERSPSPAPAPTTAAEVAAAVSPSVVRLEVERPDGEVGAGSGVVFRADGQILTTGAVVDGASAVVVVLADGARAAAEVVGTDPATGVAVVDAGGDGRTWTAADLGGAADVRVGGMAVVIGSSTDTDGRPSVTVGVVSALDRAVRTATGTMRDGLLQTDAPMGPAASGGALCDGDGAVVGLATGDGLRPDDGVGFAIPIHLAASAAEAVLADVDRAGIAGPTTSTVAAPTATPGTDPVWLGIVGTDARPELVEWLDDDGDGVLVAEVRDGAPARTAGVQPGDVLVALDDRPVTGLDELVTLLATHTPGDTVTLDLLRDALPLTLTVELASR